jgi:hypothetical protein
MLIETNTFGANALRLEKHGLQHRVRELNAAAVKLAREASRRGKVFVGGAIGPSGYFLGEASDGDLASRTRRVSRAGAKRSSSGRGRALRRDDAPDARAPRRHRSRASLRYRGKHPGHRVGLGRRERPHGRRHERGEIGPPHEGVGRRRHRRQLLRRADDRPLRGRGDGRRSACPSRGAERRPALGGSTSAWSTCRRPSTSASTRGACSSSACGSWAGVAGRRRSTSSASPRRRAWHRRQRRIAIRRARRAKSAESVSVPSSSSPEDADARGRSARGEERSRAKLGKRFVVSVEVNPPVGLDPSRAVAAAKKMLKAGGVDVINIADGARAQARMSNLAMAVRIEREAGMETILHVCGRDETSSHRSRTSSAPTISVSATSSSSPATHRRWGTFPMRRRSTISTRSVSSSSRRA